ncbi:SCO family protein [Gluconobacter sphaericus]|uniref:Copper-binding protein n=1 Tax=Gluconobacter sphaericus NBRC 12467 TaxID=1307951 RepID=A0AA37WBA5_9PROT|nr:SCO family protein [Gluconobacter sphaericus]MBF0886552.1 SCO family protein [Gluconobacter sphaericus]MBS1086782.1 SCO family protein [Gluconobacter sphaericus]MBS1100667.1 SCO family protein [Gluconobacter sphaericus]GBR54858.1 electron transport transmembrane protein Sco1/SenC/PrrC [Gluconobacter sphaericus NBRC 12467]GEB43728.1 copper-binding protein [Gluconobacter sphaericus NBRC 12467]
MQNRNGGRRKIKQPVQKQSARLSEAKKRVAPVLIIAVLFLGAIGMRGIFLKRASATLGGSYTLIDMHGHPLTERQFQGRYTLIYFGYTHCIDVCPLTLATVTQALELMGKASHQIVPLFITVDPSRDTPEVVADYVSHFSPDIVGLTGTESQIQAVIKSFHVMARRRGSPADRMSSDYLMDHSSVLYLMDGDNRLVSVLPVDTSPQEIATRLRRLVPAS